MNLKHELQSIISGIGDYSAEDIIKAAAHHIRESQKTSRDTEKSEFSKKQEAKKLTEWIDSQNLWFCEHDENRFIASGAEQRVFLYSDEKFVYKFNDTIFYEFWLDYFYSLLIHNYFFPQTAYELIGFYQEKEVLFAVVKQPFIEITEPTNLPSVKEFLNQNGFELKKNNDYFNNNIGIILEDLHDENVLTNNGVLFFIDTVFYIKDSFFIKE
jgi:hypothetical protein